jgi:dsRNA-specific ribonuclease
VWSPASTAAQGNLTRIDNVLTKGTTCAVYARILGLDRYVACNVHWMRTGTHLTSSLLADVFESLLAAVYLDQARCACWVQGMLECSQHKASDRQPGGRRVQIVAGSWVS